jgi:hypothetical protein
MLPLAVLGPRPGLVVLVLTLPLGVVAGPTRPLVPSRLAVVVLIHVGLRIGIRVSSTAFNRSTSWSPTGQLHGWGTTEICCLLMDTWGLVSTALGLHLLAKLVGRCRVHCV